MIDLLVRALILIAVGFLIFYYLIPLLPAPLGMIVLVIVVLIAIVWLIQLARRPGAFDI